MRSAERSAALTAFIDPNRHEWIAAGATVVVVLFAVGAIFQPTLASIIRVWSNSETFSHGFVILPIVLWLVWQRRHALAVLRPRPSPWALFGVAAAGFTWLIGEAGDVSSIRHFAFTAMIPLTVWAVLGPAVTRVLCFPLGFLFFAVPFGAFLIQPLMILTADMVVAMVRASGIPVYRQALQFSLPTGHWSVVEACSGIRYLIASVALGALYAHLMYRSIWRRGLFMVAAVIVPIGVNAVRAYVIVMIGHHSDMTHAVGADHLLYGWVFFGIVIFLLFWIGSWWREDVAPLACERLAPGAWRDGVPAAAHTYRRIALSGLAVIVVAASAPTYAAQVVRIDGAKPTAISAPVRAGAWQIAAPDPAGWRPDYHAPQAELQHDYVREGRILGLFVGYYRDQRRQTQMLAWNHALAPSGGDGWRQIGMRERAVSGLAGVRPAEAVIAHHYKRRLAWRWYWVDGRWTASRNEVKARVTLARLLNRSDATAVIVVHAPFEHALSEARADLLDLSRELLPELGTALAATAP